MRLFIATIDDVTYLIWATDLGTAEVRLRRALDPRRAAGFHSYRLMELIQELATVQLVLN